MKIAIVTGGETAERDISIKSCAYIANLIDFANVQIFTFPEDKHFFIREIQNFDLAIPIIHGLGGEDGSIQGLLKTLNIPFLFSDITTHAIAIDKKITKDILKNIHIHSPQEISSFPLFAKPRYGGSSVATKLCQSKNAFQMLCNANKNITFITEEPLRGREFTVGIIDIEEKSTPLPVVEIIPKNTFFDFDSKYTNENLATEICPADINSSLYIELQKQALLIHTYLGAKHISRSDFIVTPENKIYFLEINTIPGMTDTSLIPKMVSVADISFKKILKKWCINMIGK
jgi:D-alanine-D-alanine ligase